MGTWLPRRGHVLFTTERVNSELTATACAKAMVHCSMASKGTR